MGGCGGRESRHAIRNDGGIKSWEGLSGPRSALQAPCWCAQSSLASACRTNFQLFRARASQASGGAQGLQGAAASSIVQRARRWSGSSGRGNGRGNFGRCRLIQCDRPVARRQPHSSDKCNLTAQQVCCFHLPNIETSRRQASVKTRSLAIRSQVEGGSWATRKPSTADSPNSPVFVTRYYPSTGCVRYLATIESIVVGCDNDTLLQYRRPDPI